MSNKKQITVRVSEDVAEWIEQESQRIGGSNQHKGEAIERLVEENKDVSNSDLFDKIDQLEESLANDEGGVGVTHTTSKTSNIPEEIEEKDEIDPAEYDLSQFKGSGDVMDIAKKIVNYEGGMTEGEIKNLFSSEFDYSINASRNKRKSLVNQLNTVEVPEEKINSWVEDEIEDGWNKKSNTADSKISCHKNVNNPEEWFKNQWGGSLQNYLDLDDDEAKNFETVYTTDENMVEQLMILKSKIYHLKEIKSNYYLNNRISKIIGWITDEMDYYSD